MKKKLLFLVIALFTIPVYTSEPSDLNQRFIQELENENIQAANDLYNQGANSDEALILAIGNHYKSVTQLINQYDANVNYQDSNGSTPLLYAAMFNNDEAVKFLLSKGANPNKKSKKGNTPLLLAARKNHNKIVTLLLDGRAHANQANAKGHTALMLASEKGNDQVIDLLLTHDAQVNTKDKYGVTALMYAMRADSSPSIIALIEAGADPNVLDQKTGELPITLAAKQEKFYLIRVLSQHHANLEAHNKDGHTALQVAILHNNDQAVNALLQNGANPNTGDTKGNSPLAYAIPINNLTIAEELLKNGASPNKKNKLGISPLVKAIHEKNVAMINLFIKYKTDVNAQDDKGDTPLMHAVRKECFDCINPLLKAGADQNIPNAQKNTPLAEATRRIPTFQQLKKVYEARGKTAEAKKLKTQITSLTNIKKRLERALTATKPRQRQQLKKKKGRRRSTPTHMKKRFSHPRSKAPILTPSIEEPEPAPPSAPTMTTEQIQTKNTLNLWDAINDGDLKNVQRNLQKNIDASFIDENGNTFLINAAKQIFKKGNGRRVQIIKALLFHPLIKKTVNNQNALGKTALFLAVLLPKASQLLLDHGADPTIVDTNGNNVVMYAVQNYHPDITLHLLQTLKSKLITPQYKQLINKQNNDGMATLMYGVQKRYPGVVKGLLESGANSNLVNNLELTALQLAHQILEIEQLPDATNKTQVAHAQEIIKLLTPIATIEPTEEKVEEPSPTIPTTHIANPLFNELKKGNKVKKQQIKAILENITDEQLFGQHAHGITPLMLAVESGVTQEVLRILLDKLKHNLGNINLTTQERPPESALTKAIKKSKPALVELLLDHGAAIRTCDKKLVQKLYKEAQQSENQQKINNFERIIKALGKVHIKNQNQELLDATRTGDFQKAQSALAQGADLNTRSDTGDTPLIIATKYGHNNLVRTFMGNRTTNLDAQNNNGHSALITAAIHNNYDIANRLLRAGANDTLHDEDGKTAYDHAIDKRNNKIINRIAINQATKKLAKRKKIKHILKRHSEFSQKKMTSLIGNPNQDTDYQPYRGLVSTQYTSFFPKSWNKEKIIEALLEVLHNPDIIFERKDTKKAQGQILHDALIVTGEYKTIPIEIIISEVPKKGWIVFTAYPNI